MTERQQRVADSIREQSIRLEHQIDKLINLGDPLESTDYGQRSRDVRLPRVTRRLTWLRSSSWPRTAHRADVPYERHGRDGAIRPTAPTSARVQALIENAVKFARDGGRSPWSRPSARACDSRFSDDGIGIDPRYHRRIFEKFFQVEDPLTRHHGGAGLDCSYRGIVEAHGSASRSPADSGRSRFLLVLPVQGCGRQHRRTRSHERP